MYLCKVCGRNFDTGTKRSKHELTHKKVECMCPHCGKIFDRKHKLNDHINSDFENPFVLSEKLSFVTS